LPALKTVSLSSCCALVLLAASAFAGDPQPSAERIASVITATRQCTAPNSQSAKLECSYSFNGIRVSLVMEPSNPTSNTFLVKSGPTDEDTFLKFGGMHSCAIISHYGKHGEMAHVFISPKDGDVYTRWDVAACAK
jgi:hypothetical protein